MTTTTPTPTTHKGAGMFTYTDEEIVASEPTQAHKRQQADAARQREARKVILAKLAPADEAANEPDERTLVQLLTERSQTAAPAKNMTPAGGWDLEQAVAEAAQAAREAIVKRRKARWAAKSRHDAALAELNKPSKPVKAARLDEAWQVVAPLFEIITDVARAKSSHAARYLGVIGDEVASSVIESMVLALGRSDYDLTALTVAADDLSTGQRNGRGRDRRFLMQYVNVAVRNTLTEHHREQQAYGTDVIDTVLDQVFSSISDPALDNHHADAPPALMGFRFSGPGKIDPVVPAWIVTLAITEHHLDVLAEVILTSLNEIGVMDWRANAQAVFNATPQGRELWTLVEAADADTRENMAEAFAREAFAWLPELVARIAIAFTEGEYELPHNAEAPRDAISEAVDAYARVLAEIDADSLA